MERAHRDIVGSGVRVRVYEQGSHDAPVVLCIHSVFVDARSFSAIGELLADEFRIICPDLPGYGDSEKPPPNRFAYGIDDFAESLVGLYGGLGLRRTFVVGHGLGGAVAMTLAAKHPELVSRLVLVDPICQKAPLFLGERALLVPFVGGIIYKQLLGRAAFGALFRERLYGTKVSPRTIDDYFESFNSPAGRGSLLATLRATSDARPVFAQTTKLNVPTLVVWGRHDRIQPASLGLKLSREIRHAGFELFNAGHSPHEELPEEVAPCIRRFLRAERPSAGF